MHREKVDMCWLQATDTTEDNPIEELNFQALYWRSKQTIWKYVLVFFWPSNGEHLFDHHLRSIFHSSIFTHYNTTFHISEEKSLLPSTWIAANTEDQYEFVICNVCIADKNIDHKKLSERCLLTRRDHLHKQWNYCRKWQSPKSLYVYCVIMFV